MSSGRSFQQAAWLVFVAAVAGLGIWIAAAPEPQVPARIAAGALAAVALAYVIGSAVGALAAPVFFVAFSAPRVRGRPELPGWLLPLGAGAWVLGGAIAFTLVPGGEPRVAILATTVYVAYASGLGTAYLRDGRRWTAGIAFALFGAAAARIPLGIDHPVMPVAMFAGFAIRCVNERAETRRRATASV